MSHERGGEKRLPSTVTGVPGTGAVKPGSVATKTLYFVAPGTELQRMSMSVTTAPAAGVCRTGRDWLQVILKLPTGEASVVTPLSDSVARTRQCQVGPRSSRGRTAYDVEGVVKVCVPPPGKVSSVDSSTV